MVLGAYWWDNCFVFSPRTCPPVGGVRRLLVRELFPLSSEDMSPVGGVRRLLVGEMFHLWSQDMFPGL